MGYRERLWPGPLGWGVVLGAAATLGLATAPVHALVGPLVGAVTLVLGVAAAVATSPRVEVRDGELVAGRAHIPAACLGEGQVLDRSAVHAALGPGSDARDYVLVRSWLPGGVSVPVTDPADPTPRWVVSSRHPVRLLEAIDAARQAAHSEQIG
jgi:hypothetical protein